MHSAEINRRFLAFFQRHGHTLVASSPLPTRDPTLLFIPAGMAPFKPYFLGEQEPPYARAASVQKCVRTVDIDVVGTTSRHLTFFQMAGNFSFGDYFKERAIPLAWELLSSSPVDGGLGFDPDRLWATVYQDDDEAFRLWTDVVGLPPGRVQRRGMQDNFWDMGVPGPCGPCSEIYYDRGPEHGREGGPVVDEERYLEVWNLVFMESERGPGTGKDYPILGPLPGRNIDTGLGVERTATLLQGVENVFETDLLRPLLDLAVELTGTRYGGSDPDDVRLRVIADHSRTAAMLIADGVVPGNEGQGYVLRRLLRRIIQRARLLGADRAVAETLVGRAAQIMAASYPELAESRARIVAVATAEEDSFLATLRTGTTHFERAAADTRTAGSAVLSGDAAFALHDTFGFPIELTLEMAGESGLAVDEEGFRRLMAEQRARAKADAQARKTGHVDVSVYRAVRDAAGPTEFTGYASVAEQGSVRGLLVGDAPAASAGAGTEVEFILDRTPFYAESGGQLADEGSFTLASGAVLEVLDVQRPLPDLVVHRARVRSGEVLVGAAGYAEVDVERRRAISRAHTATHLIHQAVRRALGEHAAQAGSLNAPGRLRFDFTSPGGVPSSMLADVEDEVNSVLIDDLQVRAFVTTQAEAQRIGALALFGEKYGEQVRVVEVGDYARELCGGTHAARSGQLGLVKLLGESSIGAGVRRLDALVGLDAFRHLAREHVLVGQLAETLHTRPEELPGRVGELIDRLRGAEKELERLRSGAVLASAPQLAAGAQDVSGVAVVAHAAPVGTTPDDVRKLALDVRGRIDPARPAVVAVAAAGEGRAVLVVAVNDAGRQRGLAAGPLVAAGAAAVGGSGGGKDDIAQGGGARPEGVGEALAAVRDAVGRRITGG
ncbi:MAG TPA: alanine--tRNA ligase [Mycobacteriales bacterium]|nr:alanine--tRNA ligase [Mycobacteriales bacterium]